MKLPARYEKTGKTFDDGGMSNAIVCRDTFLDRDVLVKELGPGVDQKRIEDEIKALAAIRSKHVVELFDVIRDVAGKKVIAIVEEYLAGESLNDNLPIKEINSLLLALYYVACGIADIHNTGHVHRDLKPGNIKYDAEHCLKIFDFGLARNAAFNASTVGIVGTPGYLAPELCAEGLDDSVDFTQAVDIFAFGAIALKLIAGALPKPIKKLPPALPSAECDFVKVAPNLPADVAQILNRCLDTDPNSRPKIATVAKILASHLLKDRHRAALVVGGKVHLISSHNRTANISAGGLGSFSITYDGIRFMLSPSGGSVFANNISISAAVPLPGSCVITLGAVSSGSQRVFVTFDMSHPEVM